MRRLIGILILLFYYVTNVILINQAINRTLVWDKPTKTLFDYIVQTRPSLPAGTLVVASPPNFWTQEATFFTQTLGRGEVTYKTTNTRSASTEYSDWEAFIPNYPQVIKLDYDKSCLCIKETKVK